MIAHEVRLIILATHRVTFLLEREEMGKLGISRPIFHLRPGQPSLAEIILCAQLYGMEQWG